MKIIIDAGHGNNTPGKRAPDDSMREFHFNSAVARYLDVELKAYKNIQTQFPHDPTGARDVPLKERTDKANNWKADVYISIHPNAFAGQWHTGGGIETYIYTANPREARSLAEKVQHELVVTSGLRNRGVKTADFHVLRESNMTAILVECGFMDNQNELELLKSDAYRRKCAVAIAVWIAKQYGLKKKEGYKVAESKTNETSEFAKISWRKASSAHPKTGVLTFDGTNPRDPVTREQLAVILDRLGQLD